MSEPNQNEGHPETPESTPLQEAPSAELSIQKGNEEYGADDLQHLSDQEHVRERPAMYIGDITARGLHHLVYEVVDNSIDEAMAGFAHNVSVTVNNEGSVTVEDDGRGIDFDRIRERALAEGLVSDSAELDHKETEQLLFRDGFSHHMRTYPPRA